MILFERLFKTAPNDDKYKTSVIQGTLNVSSVWATLLICLKCKRVSVRTENILFEDIY